MKKCEKCDTDLYQILVLSTRLVGGVSTILCEHCVTKWNEYISQHLAYQELCRLECVRGSIVNARELSVDGHDPDLVRVLDEIRGRKLELHQVGLRWLGREV